MPATIVQQKSAVQDAEIAQLTLTLDTPATIGNEIIIIYAGDAYINIVDIPAGFVEPVGGRQEQYLGHYFWHKTSAGGESNFLIKPQSSCTFNWAIFEVSGLSGIGCLISSAGDGRSAVPGDSPTYTTPDLTLSTGERFVMTTFGGSHTLAFSGMAGWTNSFTELVDIQSTTGYTKDSMAIASRSLTVASPQTINTTATWNSGMDPESRTAIIAAFNVGSADTTAPSTPTNVSIIHRKALSLKVTWDASTDNVQVADYEVQVNGAAVGTTSATSYTVQGLLQLTSYSVRVRARDTAGNYSGLSTAVSMATVEGSGRYYWDGGAKHLINPIAIDPSTHYTTLPRVAWEGGPSYYNSVPALVGTEWTSDAFFPIGYWGAFADWQSYIDQYASLGINTLWSTYNQVADSTTWIRNAGLWNMGGSLPNPGSESVGYVLEDEADMWGGPGWGGWTGVTGFVPGVCTSGSNDCGYTIMQQTNTALPADGKMRWTNYGMGVLTWQSDEEASTFMTGGNGAWPLHLVTADMYLYTSPSTVDLESRFGVPHACARRAGNYGEQLMNKLYRIDGIAGTRKPLGILIELGSIGNTGEDMTPDRVEGAVWSTLIHEARCISYFSHAFADTALNPWTNNALNDSTGNYPQIQARVQQMHSQIIQLAPVINTQTYIWRGAPNIESMLKIKNGYAYIFAMAKVEPVHSSAPRDFVLPFGIHGKTAEVMFESRTLPVLGGCIQDSFALESSHHIYKIAL